MTIRVEVTDRCQGHARCLALAPEVFDVDDAGYGAVHADGEYPDEFRARIANAASNCPEAAIRIRR